MPNEETNSESEPGITQLNDGVYTCNGLTLDPVTGEATGESDSFYRIQQLNPAHGYGFYIELDKEFAEVLEAIEVPDKQASFEDSLNDLYLDDMYGEVRFKNDSLLLRSIRVAEQQTSLNFHKVSNDAYYTYHTKNVDTPDEALELIGVFSHWVTRMAGYLPTLAEEGHIPETV